MLSPNMDKIETIGKNNLNDRIHFVGMLIRTTAFVILLLSRGGSEAEDNVPRKGGCFGRQRGDGKRLVAFSREERGIAFQLGGDSIFADGTVKNVCRAFCFPSVTVKWRCRVIFLWEKWRGTHFPSGLFYRRSTSILKNVNGW